MSHPVDLTAAAAEEVLHPVHQTGIFFKPAWKACAVLTFSPVRHQCLPLITHSHREIHFFEMIQVHHKLDK